jgi:O-acetylhomoserine (thiol)-lyase
MAAPRAPGFDTLSLHAGYRPEPVNGSSTVPVYQTTSYVFSDTDQAGALFNLERPGYVYSRIANPTVAVLEERIAALEGGVGAVCAASGMAALHIAVATLLGSGAHIVASASLYGGTVDLLAQTLPRFGITTTFVPPRDLAGFRAALRPATRLVLGETIGNPGLEVLDIPALAAIAHEAGVPLLVDSTFATPYLCRPLDLGADLVVHSLTKWIGGHGLAIGGAVIDGGRFDWQASGRFPTLTEAGRAYQGIVFAEQYGPAAFLMRARMEGLRQFGACLAPASAFHLLQGVETLSLRMQRHMQNTAAVLEFLCTHDAVSWVAHPDLPAHPDHELARRLLPRGAGSIVSFGVRGGREAGARFIEASRLARHLANVGDARTLVIHPAGTTHRQMSAEELARAGVGEDMVRLSVGIESIEDILGDLGQALRAAGKS